MLYYMWARLSVLPEGCHEAQEALLRLRCRGPCEAVLVSYAGALKARILAEMA